MPAGSYGNGKGSLKLTEFNRNVDVLVIGMGPTGLGAAKRLNQIVSAHRQLVARGNLQGCEY
jgi:cation diffusion facilitator CzcD-associated flavoprotein CzcO